MSSSPSRKENLERLETARLISFLVTLIEQRYRKLSNRAFHFELD